MQAPTIGQPALHKGSMNARGPAACLQPQLLKYAHLDVPLCSTVYYSSAVRREYLVGWNGWIAAVMLKRCQHEVEFTRSLAFELLPGCTGPTLDWQAGRMSALTGKQCKERGSRPAELGCQAVSQSLGQGGFQ